jgi:hypothetical protein
MIRVVGYDRSGIVRVWADALDEHEAFSMCRAEIRHYVRHRPDAGPVSDWGVERHDVWLQYQD